jgi:hypothetical protein
MDKIMSVIQPYLSLIKDLVTIASIGIAGYVALRGLQTWRDQLKGTAEYELAKRLLKAAYQLRDALQSVRNPLIMAAEFSQALKEAQLDLKPGDEDYNAASTTAVYQMRWKPVTEAYRALELEAVEAETLWGSEARAATTTIRTSIGSLYSALNLVLLDMKSHVPPVLDNLSREKFRQIVYSMTDKPEEDPFLKDLTSAIKVIEDLARPYLTR